jgi:hypothetical protein
MDASVGLTFSLQLFQRYRRSGVLQAKVRHIPGIKGACTAYVHLTAGSVTTCYLENKDGQHLSFSLEKLCQIDHERGPFHWTFQPQHPVSGSQIPVSPSAQPLTSTSSLSAELDAFIPKAVAPLRWEQFKDWTPEQRLLLQYVWKSINGKRTIQEMKASLPYPPQMVNDILQILLTWRIIVLAS